MLIYSVRAISLFSFLIEYGPFILFVLDWGRLQNTISELLIESHTVGEKKNTFEKNAILTLHLPRGIQMH